MHLRSQGDTKLLIAREPRRFPLYARNESSNSSSPKAPTGESSTLHMSIAQCTALRISSSSLALRFFYPFSASTPQHNTPLFGTHVDDLYQLPRSYTFGWLWIVAHRQIKAGRQAHRYCCVLHSLCVGTSNGIGGAREATQLIVCSMVPGQL